jgi:hypothetical protein
LISVPVRLCCLIFLSHIFLCIRWLLLRQRHDPHIPQPLTIRASSPNRPAALCRLTATLPALLSVPLAQKR